MRRLIALILAVAFLAPGIALSEDRFLAATVWGQSDDDDVGIITFETIGELTQPEGEVYQLEGRAVTQGIEEPVPITITAHVPSDEDMAVVEQSSFEIKGVEGESANFQRFDYAEEAGEMTLRRILLIGRTFDGQPASVSLIDDPCPPCVVIALVLAAELAACSINQVPAWLGQCPNGFETEVTGGLTGLSCKFSCS